MKRHIKMRLLLFVFVLLPLTFAENLDLDLDGDKSDWVDLLDPFSSNTQHGNLADNQKCDNDAKVLHYQQQISRLIEANELLKSKRSETVDVLLKHILRQIFIQLNVELANGYNVNKFARIYLSQSDVATLLEYLNSQKHSEEVALREKLRSVLENFIVLEEQPDESGLIMLIRAFLPYLFILNVIFLPLAIFNVLRRVAGPRQFLGLFLVATFSLSYYFTYIRKYQEVLAERFSRVHHTNDACSPKGLIAEAFGVLLSYVRIRGKDQCLKQYEDMLVEPFLLVDPLQVFGEVVTSFLMSPFSVIGIHLNKFFNDFFIDTPIVLAAVKLVFIVLVLFYLSGYRIRTIFGTIEPAGHFIPAAIYHQQQPTEAITITRPEIVEIADQTDSFDLPMLANLDDSNVTRRRKTPQRSKSLPRTLQELTLE